MNEQQAFDQVVFSPDFASARRGDGLEIAFTRSKAAILRYLAQKPDRIVTRNQLLDAVSGEGSDKSDRNIDYIVSRIRRKLGDDAKSPRFIFTRYGEGYKWVAQTGAAAHPDADLVVGPVRGLDGVGALAPIARKFSEAVFDAIESDLPEGSTAAFRPDTHGSAGASSGQGDCLDMTFFIDANKLECILTVRNVVTGSVLAIARRQLDTRNQARLVREADDVARALLADMWRSRVKTQIDSPLPVAMHDAAGLPVGSNSSWSRNDQKLKLLLEENPTDPTLKLFFATHLHSKYILLGWDLFLKGTATCREDEDRIEELVLSALPHVIHNPTQSIMAAKLLHFLDRGYDDLAVELAEEGLRSCTDIASSLAIVGQLRSFMGRTAEALGSLDQAVRLSPYGSEFHVYAMFLKCQALAAAGDWPALAVARKELFKVRPAAMVLEPIFADPIRPSLRARALTMALTRPRARALLMNLTYVSTRLFRQPEMRENSIRPPLRLFLGRFGEGVVPAMLWETVPYLREKFPKRRR
jgi:DNA-binding winged helix-turn-helix (wHTH) protein